LGLASLSEGEVSSPFEKLSTGSEVFLAALVRPFLFLNASEASQRS